jgi:hypothetical protein
MMIEIAPYWRVKRGQVKLSCGKSKDIVRQNKDIVWPSKYEVRQNKDIVRPSKYEVWPSKYEVRPSKYKVWPSKYEVWPSQDQDLGGMHDSGYLVGRSGR